MSGPSRIIVGGSLAGGLAALALADQGLGPGVTLIESGGGLGGDAGHTWSCHESDLDDDVRGLVTPLVAHRWPRQIVRFSGRQRLLDTGYLTVTGERFARLARERLERHSISTAHSSPAARATSRSSFKQGSCAAR